MDVIHSERRPVERMARRVWSYREGMIDVMSALIQESGATALDLASLKAHIMLYEQGGERAIAAVTEDIGDGLFVFYPTVKNGQPLAPIFCPGPFGDLEFTFLQGAMWKDDEIRPYSAKGSAMENLEKLRANPRWRVPWTS